MKPALLMLHGALGAAAHFDPVISILEEQYTIHRLNFHGHGGMPLPSSSLSIELLTTQLLEYIDTNNLAPAAIFGYSMGGYVALQAALQAPEKVSRILTLATKFAWNADAAARETRQLNSTWLLEKAPAFVGQLDELHGEQNREQLLPAVAGLVNRLAGSPLLTDDTLKSIQIPVRLMVGDRDAMVSVEETLAAFRSLPNASMAVLPDTKHPVERVNKAILVWEIRSFMTL